ncbi:hypothetical protein Y032_0042g706 [Ancylostoma ceylanicum]|uniref:RING-type domain-containing protein n=1 Tax=Ancylostoma ceylanicum TaxID=53326 RepID=A0A016UHM3_9BILA|nr:hypothetical protein Y032_0042g706 [Ancylostoma ceylanicum]
MQRLICNSLYIFCCGHTICQGCAQSICRPGVSYIVCPFDRVSTAVTGGKSVFLFTSYFPRICFFACNCRCTKCKFPLLKSNLKKVSFNHAKESWYCSYNLHWVALASRVERWLV